MNRIKNVLMLIVLVITFYLIFLSGMSIPCLFKQWIGIACPGCGMTRAFNEIIHFNILGAFKYNILAVPLFIFIVYGVIVILYDIITGKRLFIDITLNFFKDNYIFIILSVFLSFVINNLQILIH
ncbi:MAG: DUF2752 domain-containing protein [Clostridia bacterium]